MNRRNALQTIAGGVLAALAPVVPKLAEKKKRRKVASVFVLVDENWKSQYFVDYGDGFQRVPEEEFNLCADEMFERNL